MSGMTQSQHSAHNQMLKPPPPIWALIYVLTAPVISWAFGWSKVPGLPLRRCRAPDRRLERPASQADADAVLAHDRRRHHRPLLVSLGALPSVPFNQQPLICAGLIAILMRL